MALALTLALFVPPERFDPSKHLPAFDECDFSEYNRLYDLDRFEDRRGDKVTAAELAEIQADWARHRAEVEARIRRIESDPAARFAWELQRKLRHDPFFGAYRFDSVDDYAPILLLVQQPPWKNKNYVASIGLEYGPCLRAVERKFRETYPSPGATPREEVPSVAIFVLAGRGMYGNYCRSGNPLGISPPDQRLAHYDWGRRFAITYEPGPDDIHQRRSEFLDTVVHESIHALMDSYSAKGLASIETLWLHEGLAQYLAAIDWDRSLGEIRGSLLDSRRLDAYVELSRIQPLGAAFFPPLRDLFQIKNLAEVRPGFMKRAQAAGITGHEQIGGRAISAFYVHSYLFMHFLHHGQEGKYRDGTIAYVRGALAGDSGEKLFLEKLGQTWARLESDYQDFLVKIAREKLGETISPSPVAATSSPSDSADEQAPDFVLEEVTTEQARGRVLERAIGGDVAGAIQEMRERGDLEEEALLLENLVTTLDEVLDHFKSEKRTLSLDPAKRQVGKVVEFDADTIVLSRSSGKFEVSRRDVSPAAIVKAARSRRLGKPELLAPALLLAGGDMDAAVALAGRESAGNLAARGESWSRCREEWRARELVAELSSLVETPPENVDRALNKLDDLLSGQGSTQAVTTNRAALVALGRTWLGLLFDRGGIESAGLTGLVSGGAKPRFRYDAPRDMLADFDREPFLAPFGFLDGTIGKGRRSTPPGEQSLEIGSDRITLQDGGALLHRAAFAGDVRAEMKVRVSFKAYDNENFPWVSLCLCVDGKKGFAAFDGVNILLNNLATGRERVASGEQLMFNAYEPLTVVFEHKGDRFVGSVDGKEVANELDLGITSGRVGLAVYGELEVEVLSMELEGNLDPTALLRWKKEWIDDEVARRWK
jgi:hypothetical protein